MGATVIDGPKSAMPIHVLANRIWLGHFGRRDRRDTERFRSHGREASNPELLDCLAGRLVGEGWRWKPLHREILLSNTYRQLSENPTEKSGQEKDPENNLRWHFSRRRLEVEEIRDAALAVSGSST